MEYDHNTLTVVIYYLLSVIPLLLKEKQRMIQIRDPPISHCIETQSTSNRLNPESLSHFNGDIASLIANHRVL